MACNFRPDVVTREVFDFYSSRAAVSRVSLHVNIKTEQKAFGNPGEFRQVLSNLLANSLDACKEGDAICVRVRAALSPSRVPRCAACASPWQTPAVAFTPST